MTSGGGTVQLEIKHKSGKYINELSLYYQTLKDEYEVLIPSGVNFKINKIDITTQPGIRIIELIEL